MVLPEFGRDRNLNQRNGLDHGDNSPDLRRVAMFAAGPDFKQGKTVRKDMKSIDVCPTICELLGVKSEHTKGKVYEGGVNIPLIISGPALAEAAIGAETSGLE